MARKRKRRMMNQINVVPYIDVMLVLLVIFMVTAPMTNPGVVELPKVGQDMKPQSSVPIVVTVKKSGATEIEGNQFARDALLVEIRTQIEKAERPVVVAADEATPYGEVVAVMDLLKQAQVDKVGLLFQPSK